MRIALTLIVVVSLGATVHAQSHPTPGQGAAKPVEAATTAAASDAARPRVVSATEAAARIAAALESMDPPAAASSRPARAAKPVAPRYQVRWPSNDARWRLTWSEQDRVTLIWNP